MQLLKLTPISKAVYVPNDRHGFKDAALLDFGQRMGLIRCAIKDHDRLECWDADSSIFGSGWTDELMQRLRVLHPDAYFCLVTGADNLSSLTRWHNFAWLAENVHFIIVPRAGHGDDHQILSRIRHSWVGMPLVIVSSSEIRSRVKKGKSITGMVPASIEMDIIRFYGKGTD